LSDGIKRYVNGIVDMGDLVFKFLYDNTSETSNYRILRGLQAAGTATGFRLTYPDGTSHEFTASVSVKMDSAAVNGALTFTCAMNLQSNITVKNPVTV
ncbi:MAG: phage tail tube protein, partial [Angelakisella sp.]